MMWFVGILKIYSMMLFHFTGVAEQTSREDLKELFGGYGNISWVEFERGQTEVRDDGDKLSAYPVCEEINKDHSMKLIILTAIIF